MTCVPQVIKTVFNWQKVYVFPSFMNLIVISFLDCTCCALAFSIHSQIMNKIQKAILLKIGNQVSVNWGPNSTFAVEGNTKILCP